MRVAIIWGVAKIVVLEVANQKFNLMCTSGDGRVEVV